MYPVKQKPHFSLLPTYFFFFFVIKVWWSSSRAIEGEALHLPFWVEMASLSPFSPRRRLKKKKLGFCLLLFGTSLSSVSLYSHLPLFFSSHSDPHWIHHSPIFTLYLLPPQKKKLKTDLLDINYGESQPGHIIERPRCSKFLGIMLLFSLLIINLFWVNYLGYFHGRKISIRSRVADMRSVRTQAFKSQPDQTLHH